jgi:hypothetical protein
MNKLLLSGLTVAVLSFSGLAAQASTADEMMLTRLTGVTEITQSGVALVDFVQGRPMAAQRNDHIVLASTERAQAQAVAYYDQNTMVTFALVLLAALAFVGVTFASKALGKSASPDAPRPEGWREDLMQMLEADLTNLDSLMHGFPGR